MEVHFGTQRTASIAFSQYFVFRNSQVEDSFQPTNHLNVSGSDNEDLNKGDEEVSRFLKIWFVCFVTSKSVKRMNINSNCINISYFSNCAFIHLINEKVSNSF